MTDHLAVLRDEFGAEDGSFLIRLRADLDWDRAAFTRLERSMRAVCLSVQDDAVLERRLAEGFFVVSRFVRDWSTHENFPRPEPAYHAACLERLDDLAGWYFSGRHPYLEPHVWVDL